MHDKQYKYRNDIYKKNNYSVVLYNKFRSIIHIKPITYERTPTNKMYLVPNCVMITPAIPAPIVVPKLTEVRNNPFEKSGALGAADITQY